MLHLNVEITLAEQLFIFSGDSNGCVSLPGLQQSGDFTGFASRRCNQSFGMFAQQLLVGSWAIVETLRMRAAYDLQKVAIANLILSQQHKMKETLSRFAGSISTIPRSYIDFTADNRFDIAPDGLAIELDDPTHHPMIGEGNGVHPQFLGSIQ